MDQKFKSKRRNKWQLYPKESRLWIGGNLLTQYVIDLIFQHNLIIKDRRRNKCVLTDAREQIIEPLLGEQRVLQTTEVQFEDAGNRVDVMIVLLVRQGIVS